MRRLHALVGWSFLALLLVWPPVHILLARQYHFSTWRYGGFGMYAAPDGTDREVVVFVPACTTRAMASGRARASSRSLGYYYEVHGQRLDAMTLPDFEPEEERSLKATIGDVRSLARPEDFVRLARWVDARLVAGPRRDRPLIVLVTEPHVDAATRSAHAEVFGVVREHDAWWRISMRHGEDAFKLAIDQLGACP